jgi:hypothetical protein
MATAVWLDAGADLGLEVLEFHRAVDLQGALHIPLAVHQSQGFPVKVPADGTNGTVDQLLVDACSFRRLEDIGLIGGDNGLLVPLGKGDFDVLPRQRRLNLGEILGELFEEFDPVVKVFRAGLRHQPRGGRPERAILT